MDRAVKYFLNKHEASQERWLVITQLIMEGHSYEKIAEILESSYDSIRVSANYLCKITKTKNRYGLMAEIYQMEKELTSREI